MKMRSAAILAVLVLASAATLRADARDEAEKQVKFGIQVAQHNLWREATLRFERATEMDPTYAPAWNNLGIAFEQQGELEKAERAYARARDLDPDNQYIQQNHELFREIHDRATRQNRR
jgi:Flp pilus assembly protein TadD